jgi:hypothetical protein
MSHYQTQQFILTGRSGQQYQFATYPLGTVWNPVGAVYTVHNNQVLYIGQTGDLKTRFSDHHHAYGFTLHRATGVGILREESEVRRRAIEADLVAAYRPPLNETNHG